MVYNGQTPPEPRVFDTSTGSFKTASLPAVPAGEELQTSQCVVTRDGGDLRVAYVVATQTPASGLAPLKNHKRAHLLTLDGAAPVASVDLPLSAEIRGSSSFGVPLLVREDAEGVRTEVLRPSDLTSSWARPGEPAWVSTPTALAIYQTENPAMVDIVDARSGKTIASAPIVEQLDSRKLLAFTDGFRVGNRIIRTSDGKTLPAVADTDFTGTEYELSQDFFLMEGSDLLQVYDINTGKPVLDRRGEDVGSLDLRGVKLFGDRLFLHSTSSAGVDTRTIIGLPSQAELATTWSAIPYADLEGWTLTSSNCLSAELVIEHCDDMKLVKDVDGRYPPFAEQ
ncbi:hypothetical protein KTR9_4964 (plasmid) [Gordonia sp. KTR9]|nr:hypothetical protein KTR9_4964 [Gordonia sp. KTR9]